MSLAREHTGSVLKTHTIRLVSICLSLCAFVMVVRGFILKLLDWQTLPSPVAIIKAGGGAYYDFLVIVPVTAAALAFVYFTRHSEKRNRVVVRFYWGFAVLFLLMALANVPMVHYLGSPLTYEWLYYADFLRTGETRGFVTHVLSFQMAAIGMACVAGMIGVAVAVNRFIPALYTRIPNTFSSRIPHGPVLAGVLICLLYFPIAGYMINQRNIAYSKTANPAVAFAQSALLRGSAPAIFTMETSVGPDDFQMAGERPPEAILAADAAETPIRNVLLFVFESVSAEYVDLYGGTFGVTPHLNRFRDQSVMFNNFYAHAPSSPMALVSILTSTYPFPPYYMLTRDNPEIGLHAMSGELAARGMRTGLFYSSDLRYVGQDAFLSHRGFDLIRDYRTLSCEDEFVIDWDYLNSVDDHCTANAFLEWVSEDPKEPFFGVVWTNMTHFPYQVLGEEYDFGVEEPSFNRYLNALRHGDQAFGNIMESLEREGLLESTLVVVTADHGESFGQHDRWVHSTLYDHGVRVPLLLINRKLFDGREDDTIGGHVDLAPTIMDLLNLPLAPTWQGRSLFSPYRSERTYFLVPWGDLEFGYREGPHKYIFKVLRGSIGSRSHFEMYDLAADPEEQSDLMPDYGSLKREAIQERLAAWVQYQSRMIQAVTEMDRKQPVWSADSGD